MLEALGAIFRVCPLECDLPSATSQVSRAVCACGHRSARSVSVDKEHRRRGQDQHVAASILEGSPCGRTSLSTGQETTHHVTHPQLKHTSLARVALPRLSSPAARLARARLDVRQEVEPAATEVRVREACDEDEGRGWWCRRVTMSWQQASACRDGKRDGPAEG